jgi:hypothetical protein
MGARRCATTAWNQAIRQFVPVRSGSIAPFPAGVLSLR